jgi:hypothetical protein
MMGRDVRSTGKELAYLIEHGKLKFAITFMELPFRNVIFQDLDALVFFKSRTKSTFSNALLEVFTHDLSELTLISRACQTYHSLGFLFKGR